MGFLPGKRRYGQTSLDDAAQPRRVSHAAAAGAERRFRRNHHRSPPAPLPPRAVRCS